jgi:hypothetical protein
MSRVQRAISYLAPPALCLLIYWRAAFTWFRMDDFAWLNLPRIIQHPADLYYLVSPQAQGTIRLLSERLYFWAVAGLFGYRAGVFHAISLGIWFLCLALIQLIGYRLTGSRAAGLIAALLWTASAVIATPLDWASCFNQVLCSLFALFAFASRLEWFSGAIAESTGRRCEAVSYLLGFGALETIVVYPAVVLLHAAVDPAARKHWKSTLWMLVPAAAFGAAHLWLIPKAPNDIYLLTVDRRLPSTLVHYLGWALGPSQTDTLPTGWETAGLAATWAIGIALAAFLAWRVIRGERMSLFFAGWFLLWIAPVLPLANHITEYYVTIPGIGLAWLAGAAIVSAWRSGWLTRVLACALAAAYVIGSWVEIQQITGFHMRMGSRMRVAFRAVESALAAHPARALVLQGVDYELFRGGFRDDPFALLGVDRVWLAPGDDAVLERAEFGDVSRFRTSPEALLPLIEAGEVRVINLDNDQPREATRAYRQVLAAQFLATHRNRIETGNPLYAPRLGEGWFTIENGARWIGRHATAILGEPETLAQKLYVEGYAARAALESGPLRLTLRAGGREVASVPLLEANKLFRVEAELPKDLVPAYSLEIGIDCSRTFRPPGDGRDLGIVINAIELRP